MQQVDEDIKKRLRSHSAKSPEENSSPCWTTTTKKSSTKKLAKKDSVSSKSNNLEPQKSAAKEKADKFQEQEMTSRDSTQVKPVDPTAPTTTVQQPGELIQTLMKEVQGIKQKLDAPSKCDHRSAVEKINDIENKASSESFKLKLLTAIVIRQDQKIDELTAEVKSLQKAQKRANIFISGLLESEAEQTEYQRIEVVKNFIKEKLEVSKDISIRAARRQGQGNLRQMCITFGNLDDKYKILAKSSKLKGKQNARCKLYFINEDLINEEREAKKYMQELRRENMDRDDADKLKITLRKGKLFVNNEFVKPKVEIPSAADILTMEDSEINNLKEVKVFESNVHEENFSEFCSFYQRVRSKFDVQKGYAKLKLKHGDATHITAAYKLEGATGPYLQGYIDDGEAGAGRSILKQIKSANCENIAIFIVRFYGEKHLGKRHFDIYTMLAKGAIKQLRNRLDKLERANRMRRLIHNYHSYPKHQSFQ